MAEYILLRKIQTPVEAATVNGVASGTVSMLAQGNAFATGGTAGNDEGVWSEVQLGIGNLVDARRVVTPAAGYYPNSSGVSFWKDNVFNRTDATGPNESSVYHSYPTWDLVGGEELRAEWTDVNGIPRETVYVVPPPAPVVPTASGVISANGDIYVPSASSGVKGPSGQWPEGFPAYATPATITTNGSMADLQSKLASAPNNSVIEHAGNITATNNLTSSGNTIVVRPPIGQRDNYQLGAVDVKSSNLLIAGFRQTSKCFFYNVQNSGLAWWEMDGPASIRVMGYTANINNSMLLYEGVARVPNPNSGDRIVLHAQAANVYTEADIVGCWMYGTHDPNPGDHADTLQCVFLSGGSGFIRMRDSVFWPSDDKLIQGVGTNYVADMQNVWICGPPQARTLDPNLIVTLYHIGNAVSTIGTGSYVQGTWHPDFKATIEDSFVSSNLAFIDGGGNTVLSSLVPPPSVPSAAALDSIWSP